MYQGKGSKSWLQCTGARRGAAPRLRVERLCLPGVLCAEPERVARPPLPGVPQTEFGLIS